MLRICTPLESTSEWHPCFSLSLHREWGGKSTQQNVRTLNVESSKGEMATKCNFFTLSVFVQKCSKKIFSLLSPLCYIQLYEEELVFVQHGPSESPPLFSALWATHCPLFLSPTFSPSPIYPFPLRKKRRIMDPVGSSGVVVAAVSPVT